MSIQSQHQIQILHVDDEPNFADLTTTFLERESDRFTVETATSADEGLERIDDRPPDCVVSDYNMPGMDGIEFLQAVREEYPDLPFILFTGKGSEAVASDAISAGVTDYLQKDSGSEQYELLANRIRNAVRARRGTDRADRQEQLMRLTEVAGNTGGWELELETEELALTDGAQRLLGLSDDVLTLEGALDQLHPDDRDEVRATLDQAIRMDEEVQGTWRVRADGGEQRTLGVRATPVRSNGEVTALRGAINDATGRYERGQELEQIIETVPGCVVKLNPEGEFVFANERAEDVLGLDSERVTGRTYNDPKWNLQDSKGNPIPDEELPFQQIQETGEPVRGERLNVEWPDGTRRLLRVNGTPIFSEDGSFESAVFSLIDVTDKWERQQELRLIQQAIDEVNVAITLIDPHQDGNPLVYVNDAYEELTGYSEEEALRQNCWWLQGENTDPDAVSALREAIDDETQTTVELRSYRKDGTEFWNRVTITPVYNDDGDVIRYLGTQEDVTERKEREQRLEETTRQLQVVLDTVNASVVIKDVQGKYRYANEQTRQNLGIDADEDITGLTDHDLLPADVADTYQADDQRVIEAGETVEIEEEVPTPEGTQINQTLKSPFYGVDGELVGICAVSTDITEQKQRQQELERQNERLEEFTSVVSHDLRNPLRTAEGRLELARDDCDSAHLDDMADALDRMDALIQDVLTLARSGENVGSTEAVSLSSLIEKCWEVVPSENATLSIETDQTISADRSRLQQVLENLFANAVEHGGEDVTVRVGDLEDGFYVADDGVGIPDEKREDIFGAGYSTAEGGTGFGLRITKQIVNAHGWDIQVTDSGHDGAQFEITGVDTPE